MIRNFYGLLIVIYLFITNCCSFITNSEENRKYIIEPKKEEFPISLGKNVTLDCRIRNSKSKIVRWEFKPCTINYQGMTCDNKSQWKQFKSYKNRINLHFVNLSDIGIFRCFHDEIIKRIFRPKINIYDWMSQERPKPYIENLQITRYPNYKYILMCNVTCKTPPTIVWLRPNNKRSPLDNIISYCPETKIYNNGNTHICKLHNISNDAGVFVCLALTQFGSHNKSIVIEEASNSSNSFNYNFFLILLLVGVIIKL